MTKIRTIKLYNDMQQKNDTVASSVGMPKGKSHGYSMSIKLLVLCSQKLENENVELEFQVRNYEKEIAHLKTTYKNLFDSISVTRAQTKTIIDSLQHKLHDTIYENLLKLRAQLFDKVSDQVDNHKRVLFRERLGGTICFSDVGQFCDSDLEVAFRRNSVFCQKSRWKKQRASHSPKPVPNSKQRLHLLHMDLVVGPLRLLDKMDKRYVLCDCGLLIELHLGNFSDTLDEAPEVILKTLKAYYCPFVSLLWYSVETPQQNGVVDEKSDISDGCLNNVDFLSFTVILLGLELELLLRATLKSGAILSLRFGIELTGFSDGQLCRDVKKPFKSYFGGAQFLGEKLVSWSQRLTSLYMQLSTAEAEYIPIYCDSKSAIAISCNPDAKIPTGADLSPKLFSRRIQLFGSTALAETGSMHIYRDHIDDSDIEDKSSLDPCRCNAKTLLATQKSSQKISVSFLTEINTFLSAFGHSEIVDIEKSDTFQYSQLKNEILLEPTFQALGTEVEHSKPRFELQRAIMESYGSFWVKRPSIIREQRIAAYKGYRGGGLVYDVSKLENQWWRSRIVD
ncbi:hypothetical protein Tco_1041448 [Tanacetum coccineum]|uniref:Uncharacterized protein n=1 Tax=Tanacetum coccineum TaxID=301880 RepID=A0ABQ5GIS5_9ASTR